MRTHLLLASLLPPLAVALTGRWGQALLNVPLTMLGWLPGAVHAVAVVIGAPRSGQAEQLRDLRHRDRRLEVPLLQALDRDVARAAPGLTLEAWVTPHFTGYHQPIIAKGDTQYALKQTNKNLEFFIHGGGQWTQAVDARATKLNGPVRWKVTDSLPLPGVKGVPKNYPFASWNSTAPNPQLGNALDETTTELRPLATPLMASVSRSLRRR